MRMDNGQPDETATAEEPILKYGDLPDVRNSRLEAAAHTLVLRVRAEIESAPLADLGFDTQALLDLCNNVEDAIDLAQSAVLPTPKLLEVTGNVEEKELAARYMDQKEKACRNYALKNPRLAEQFEHAAEMFRVCAGDFRHEMHLPSIEINGRVIPYNESNDTGIRHEDNLRRFFQDIYARNKKAGWWTEITTGEDKKRNVGELFMLFVTEIAEAYLSYVENAADDKLPEHCGVGVELADLGIRWADFCGAALAGNIIEHDPFVHNPAEAMFREIVDIAMKYDAMRKTPEAVGESETAGFLPAFDVAMMTDHKLAFNANRPDHKIENRLKDDGKRT